jgi:tripartite ATP-independent transporter DctP family solute receptor
MRAGRTDCLDPRAAEALAAGNEHMTIGRNHMLKRSLALAAIAGATLASAAAAQTKLNWAHVYEVTEPFHTESLWAAEEIAKRTDGRYEVAVFPASQLGKEADINQGLKLGTVDIIISGSSFAAREYPPIGITYYPYIFRDPDHLIAYTKSDVFERLAAGYEEASGGNHITAVTYYGTRQTTANKDIKVCADLDGVKMRVPDVPAYLAMPQSCGANTAPIAFAEVYLALQNGTVDAQENPLTTIEAKKFYEVQSHISLTAHIVDHLNTVVSGTRWKSLSDEDKAIFTEVMQEAAVRATDIIKQREAELVQTFKDKGIVVTEPDRQTFVDAVHKNRSVESMGFDRADFDAIQAIPSSGS